MSISKNPRFDLKRKRKRILETGMILSLAFLIFAFKLFPDVGKTIQIEKDVQDVYVTETPTQTDQRPKIPPPPEPQIVVEAPGD